MRPVNVGGKVALFAGVCVAVIGLTARPARAQAAGCQDELGMADGMLQDLATSVATVKKESDADFVSKYHQKTVTNKLVFTLTAVDGAVQCLAKAAGDAAGAARKDSESKLKSQISGYREALKAKSDPKAAKELIGTFDLPALATTASK